MKKIINSDKFIITILALIASVGIFLFWGKQGHVIIDWGRELLISEQVSKGLVLYKDIFNIYGPFAYQLNAILFKIFGISTNTLYAVGAIVAILITSGTYLLSREFLNKKMSFFITLTIIASGVYKRHIFNFTVPYSYDMTYALCGFIYSLIAITKYNKTGEAKYAYASSFLAGLCCCCKYEFAFYPLVLLLNFIWIKPLGTKKILKAIAIFLIIPVLSFGTLIIQGLGVHDFSNTIKLFKAIAQAPALEYFYRNGNGFDITNIHNTALILTILVVIATAVKFKKLLKKPELLILSITTILFCLKNFITPGLNLYGVFFMPILLPTVIALIRKDSKIFDYTIITLLIIYSASSIMYSWKQINLLKYRISTPKGYIGVASSRGSTSLVIKVLQSKTNKKDRIVILPEGQLINFLSDRNSDPFYSNLIPMYIEAFGENNIIDHYKQTPPKYFILNDRDTSEYGKKIICADYANKLCSWIFDNYHVVYRIDGEPLYFIFRKND